MMHRWVGKDSSPRRTPMAIFRCEAYHGENRALLSDASTAQPMEAATGVCAGAKGDKERESGKNERRGWAGAGSKITGTGERRRRNRGKKSRSMRWLTRESFDFDSWKNRAGKF